ncbi:MAG: uroporphyrinogen decarboxylase [Chlamydiales bacterium 38-26]|nr:uroporphyrinogen decarboxylase [Chlamydiales bacterium]OJV11462.1 MAG: uroporphyrinogen decarboxylase [Chlamydiales bacterium 38-26]
MTILTKTLVNNKVLLALRGENQGRPPVWLMRQAGRYMPEYRAIRARHSFLEMCHHPDLIVEVTQLPLKAFDLDAAILFSDILVVPEAFDVGLSFDEGKGPVIARPIQTTKDIENLPSFDVQDKLAYVAAGIRLLKLDLKVPLLGFCGAPFTVASYMIEGGSSRDLLKTKEWLLRDPESFHALLRKIALATKQYIELQIEAGVDVIQIFDSWANHLSWSQFEEFSFAYMKELVEIGKTYNIPIILYCRGSSVFASKLVEAGSQGISLDWNCDLASMRRVVPFNVALQGNLDPDILFAPRGKIEHDVIQLLNSMHGDPAFIFNLGHGIKPGTPYDAVKTLVETVKNHISI